MAVVLSRAAVFFLQESPASLSLIFSIKANTVSPLQSNALLSLKTMLNKLLFSFLCLLQFSAMGQKRTIEYDFAPSDFTPQEEKLIAKEMEWPCEIEYGFLGVSGYSLDLQEITLEIRFLKDDHWQEWQTLGSGHNSEESERQTFVLEPFEEEISAWQIRLDRAPISNLQLRFFAAPAEKKNLGTNVNSSEASTCACPAPPQCDRSCWCPAGDCNPPNYSTTTPTHLIVHHSAGFTNYNDYQWVVNYYWDLHVNTNGWSDIGYNWLIDPNGIVYEGRGSGNLGAHFSCLNSGTIGICIIGNYMNNTVAPNALASLKELALWEACQYNIAIADSSLHATSNLVLNHLSGHRDANGATVGCPKGTVCPGDLLFAIIDSLALDMSNSACYLTEKEFKQTRFSIFPNPTENELTISATSFPWDLKIINIKGQEVATFQSSESEKSLKLSHLKPGIYQVIFNSPAGKSYQKIQIK